ncbi:MAG: branched-chain amino acid ABC transporter permease [Proteobacteria bacterium]|nr:branched-chain amino acid ABC transporter permease [Pseudomonadota bacterium]
MAIDLQQALASGCFLGLVYALIALGFAITFGVMRIANFAHGEFVMAGMYAMVFFNGHLGLPTALAVVLATVIVAACGMAFERLTIEPIAGYSHFMQMIVTLGGLLIMQQIAALIFGDAAMGLNLKYPSLDLQLGAAYITGTRVVAGVVALAAIAAVFLGLRHTFFGRAVRAVADNRVPAQLLGVKARTVNMSAFGLGAGCAGLAGALIVPFLYVTPNIGLALTVKSFIVVMIAGSRSMTRIIAVGVGLGMVEAVAGVYAPLSLVPAIVYAALITALMVTMVRQARHGSLISIGEKDVA